MEERITSMIPRYGKLNKTYTEITSGDGLSFEKQKFIHDFYKEYEDTQTFEKALISLMLETEGTHFSILLNSLKREIENNISMYNTCKEFFDRLDIEHICRQHERCHDRDIERQMQITNEYYRELMEANGSLEAVGFREHDRQEEERLEKRYGQCKREYDREKAKLDELYAQKEQARREALQYLKNRCGDIYRLDGSLLAILEKYMTGQKKKEGEEKEIFVSLREGSIEDMLVRNEIPEFEVTNSAGERQKTGDILKGADGVICFLEEGAEPTEHVLNELMERAGDWNAMTDSGVRLVFIVRDKEALSNKTVSRTLEKIPAVTVVYDPEGESAEPVARRMYVDPEKLLLVVTRDGMTGIYASSGYNVGSVDLMLKILSLQENR